MAVQFRDYYEILGVSRDATAAEIRKAFRKQARKYHPDVAGEKASAEEKFKEVNEAYEVLGNPEKRKKYDRLGADWNRAGGGAPGGEGYGYYGPGSQSGGQEFHFEGTGFSDFFEKFFGGGGGQFGGFGGSRDFGGRPCPSRGRDSEIDMLVSLDEVMRGGERRLTFSGGHQGKCTVTVRIPKGVTEGQLVRCAGLGSPGMNGGEAGDVFLRVRLERHPDYRVEEHDLYHDLQLAPWEAVLGSKAKLRTLHGPVRLTIPPGTESETLMRVAGKGLPKGKSGSFGGPFVQTDIVTPTQVDAGERKLWQALADHSNFNPRQP